MKKKKKPEPLKIIHEDHPVIEMLVEDLLARQQRLSLGTSTIQDVAQDRDPPFVFLLNTNDINDGRVERR